MSRKIKFRVWDQKDKKYLLPEKQGFVILPTMPSFGVTLPYENRSNPGNIDEDCIDWADADLLMGRYELEQFTGLKDKNCKEIYEGDVVRYYSGILLGHAICVVTFYNCRWALSQHDAPVWAISEGDSENIEVIGNTHENKELWSESD